MKLTGKVIAVIMALVMILSLSATAFAAETTYKLTINNEDTEHTYEAYQIFKGTLSEDGTTLSNVEWGDSIARGDALLAALLNDEKTISLTSGSTTTLKNVFASAAALEKTEDQFDKMVELLGSVSNDSSTLDRFAEIVGAATYDSTGTFTGHTYLGNPMATDDYADSKYELELPAGYYLIKDEEGSQNGEDDFYTKYIVRVVKEASINPKGSGVTVDKTINDTLGGTYDNVEDFDINDDVFYKLVGTLPTNLRAYDEYWYKFTDTLPAGVTFERIEQIYVESHNGAVVHTFYDLNDDSTTNDTLPYNNNGTENDTTDDWYITANAAGNTVTVEFSDLLKLYSSLLSTDKVVVKYSCYLNRDALVAEANTNEVYLEYDNNPNGEGHGKTVTDEAHAFSFSVIIDKYDMADTAKKLAGVEFKLYYRTVDENENIIPMYAQVITEERIYQVDENGDLLTDENGAYILRDANEADTNKKPFEVNGKAVLPKDLGVVYGWTADANAASILDTDSEGHIRVEGLDEGTYFLEEIATVDGYNKLDTPVQIDIIPTYSDEGDSVTVEYKVDSITQGNNDVVGVRNSKGSTLPSTGGMGTTLFYILGGIMVLAAVVLLVTKKRMKTEA